MRTRRLMLNMEVLEDRKMMSAAGFRGGGQTVAVIDSGIAYDHVALSDNYIGGYDFAEDDPDPYDDGPAGSTGTHMAGIIAGLVPDVDIVALRVFDDQGGVGFERIEAALQWVHQNKDAFENPITTVNLSLAAAWNGGSPPNWAMLEDELLQLEQDGIFVAAAAGNNFTVDPVPGLAYPAASPHVIPVMSIDEDGSLSYFSQRHEAAIAAPGRSVTSAVPDYAGDGNGQSDDWQSLSGTSVATPHVAAAAVAIREAMAASGASEIDQQAIYTHIRDHADVVFDSETGLNYRVLNLEDCIDELATSAPAPAISARLFYHHSAFGDQPDTTKVPFRPGQSASFENISGYDRGINGVVIDIPDLPRNGTLLRASDLVVSVGSGDDLSTWTRGPKPQVTIVGGGGKDGLDRIRITFPDYSIVDTYVAITLKANDHTGLSSPYTVVFGSSVGDTGMNLPADRFQSDAADLLALGRHLSTEAEIDNPYDLNKDGRVNAMDLYLTARSSAERGGLRRW